MVHKLFYGVIKTLVREKLQSLETTVTGVLKPETVPPTYNRVVGRSFRSASNAYDQLFTVGTGLLIFKTCLNLCLLFDIKNVFNTAC